MKNIIIVCDKAHEKYANSLHQLVVMIIPIINIDVQWI